MVFIFRENKSSSNEEIYGTVYARVRNGNKNSKYSLGLTMKQTEWEKFKTYKFNSASLITSLGIRYGQFATILSQIKVSLEDNFDPNTAPTIIYSTIQAVLNNKEIQIVEKPNQQPKLLFRDYLAKYIEDFITGRRTKKGRSTAVSEGYVRSLKSCLSSFKDYETVRRRRMSIDSINMEFQRDFIKYLKDQGLRANTISTRMGVIRTTMQSAYEEKKTKCEDFRNSGFTPAKEKAEEIYLSPERIEQMRQLDLSTIDSIQNLINNAGFDKKRLKEIGQIKSREANSLQITRDIFLVGCMTGQRYSDYSRISKDMYCQIKEETFIRIKQIKTGNTVYIPLDDRVDEILEKYHGALPKISMITFAKSLKFIGELLKWTWEHQFENPRPCDKGKKFFELLTSHTARRTFATNAYAEGIPLSSIMAITGHTTEKNLRIYLRLEKQEKAVIAAADFKGFIHKKKQNSNEVESNS